MTEFKRIPLKDIFIPERLRDVEDDHALVIARSIEQHGLINPVTVRKTPAQKAGKYTLVAGAHRIRAFNLSGWSDIDAIIVEADALEGQLIEVAENLFRNELSVIDRAIFVQSYRDIWEQKHGKIDRRNNLKVGDQLPKGQVVLSGKSQEAGDPIAPLVDIIAESAERGFATHVADRMGVSVKKVTRLNQIAQNLNSNLRAKLRGTPWADNQSMLLKLAKMEPKKQAEISVGLQFGADLETALEAVEDPQPKPDAQTVLFSRLIDTWRRASAETKAKFIEHIQPVIDEAA
ncbi:chromosome partitioning protein, ParB family [Ensifer adhaerens]|nr:chromosome partitioning protein, ParB family [Ensifer adhaerens]